MAVLPLDAYYADLSHLSFEDRLQVNFDHPDAIDVDLVLAHLDTLARGESVPVPVYDFAAYTRSDESVTVEPQPIIVVEGILVLHFPQLVERLHRSIYLEVPPTVRKARRISRDVVERGRLADEVSQVFDEIVQPMHDLFVEPGRTRADHVVNFESDPDEIVVRLLREIDDPVLVGA
jgi:uridine kinase